jgi:hypothetical protein
MKCAKHCQHRRLIGLISVAGFHEVVLYMWLCLAKTPNCWWIKRLSVFRAYRTRTVLVSETDPNCPLAEACCKRSILPSKDLTCPHFPQKTDYDFRIQERAGRFEDLAHGGAGGGSEHGLGSAAVGDPKKRMELVAMKAVVEQVQQQYAFSQRRAGEAALWISTIARTAAPEWRSGET